MNLSPAQLEAIVMALLAVNAWPIDKVLAALPALRTAGLLDPAQVAAADIGPLTVKLAAAGYDRGLLTELFALRLQNLMRAVRDGALDAVAAAHRSGDREAAVAALCTVKGIGPRVADTAWQLIH
jgi:3-methyladenine DNA glycosylase/8-oxoguanine DNA glycosylase